MFQVWQNTTILIAIIHEYRYSFTFIQKQISCKKKSILSKKIMGNQCCFNMKQRRDYSETKEINLINQQSIEPEIQSDLNDSNPILSKYPPSSSRQDSSRHNSLNVNKKQEYNTSQNTTTDPKSIQGYSQSIDILNNFDSLKSQQQLIGIKNGKEQYHQKQPFNDYSDLQQTFRPFHNSEKGMEMEKKLQLLEHYINEQQIVEQINAFKQPSIVEKIHNEKEVDDCLSKDQDLASLSNVKAIEIQYFEQNQFDALLRVVDQMQQTSFKEASTASIQTSLQQTTTNIIEKVYKIKETGDTYIGSWNDKNQREGFGKLLGANGIYYEGEWVADKFEGKGIYIEKDKVCIKGFFRNGLPNGNCIQVKIIRKPSNFLKKRETTKEPDEYDEISKKTSLQTINCEFSGYIQCRYKGEIHFGQKHGNGELIIDKCLRYVGGFACDKFHGYGICVWNKGGIYEGSWVNDKKEGKGSELWPCGKSYQGEYINDQFHGYGQLINEDGEIYEGYWSNGQMDGSGILTKADKTQIYGKWSNGELIQTVPL